MCLLLLPDLHFRHNLGTLGSERKHFLTSDGAGGVLGTKVGLSVRTRIETGDRAFVLVDLDEKIFISRDEGLNALFYQLKCAFGVYEALGYVFDTLHCLEIRHFSLGHHSAIIKHCAIVALFLLHAFLGR